MGLDVVDMVMAVEEEFDLPIPGDDWWMFRTVGDLADYIVRNRPRGGICPNLVAFVRVRRGLIKVCGAQRSAIHPKSGLADLFPPPLRRQLWSALNRELSCLLPDLIHTTELRRTFGSALAGVFVCMVAAPFVLLLFENASPRLLGFACLTAVFSPLIMWLVVATCSHYSEPLRREFAWPNATVGDLTRYLARQPRLEVPQSDEHSSDDNAVHDVFLRLRQIVSERLCVPIDEVHLGSRFIEDLGAG